MKPAAGIDPGAKGGIAVIDELGLPFALPLPLRQGPDGLKLLDMPAVEAAIPAGCPVWVERVWARLRDGSKQAFAFGGNYHMIHLALKELGYKVHTVTPQRWQKRILTNSLNAVTLPFPPPKGAKVSKILGMKYCAKRWPGDNLLVPKGCRVAHDGISDALCIAAYGQTEDYNEEG